MTDIPLATQSSVSDQPVFFPVSVLKLAILSTFTLGLYNIYWFYQNWKLEQTRSEKRFGLSPGIRAFFAPLSSYSLFKRANSQLTQTGEPPVHAGLLAIAYFIWASSWRLPDPFWIICLLSFVPLLPVQAAVNRLNQRVAPSALKNDHYSGVNVAIIVVGAIFIILILAGLFLASEQRAAPTPSVAT